MDESPSQSLDASTSSKYPDVKRRRAKPAADNDDGAEPNFRSVAADGGAAGSPAAADGARGAPLLADRASVGGCSPDAPPSANSPASLPTADSDGRNNWVDTLTLWSSVQRHGEELQRRRRMLEQAQHNHAKSCTGASWNVDWPRRLMQRARTQLIVASRVAAKDPYTVVVPVLMLICILAFGLWGVFSVSYAIRDGRRQAALNAAVDFSNTLKSHIAATVAPASTVATLIKLQPDWGQIRDTFYDVAPELVVKGRQTDAILTIVLAPQGVVSAIVPPDLPDWGKVLGLDLLREPAWRNDALKTVQLHTQGMVLTGPSRLRAGMMGIVSRFPVFIANSSANDTFGFNGSAYNCAPCYVPPTATTPGQRFWGFAQLNVDWEVLIRNVTRMYDLCERDNLHFNMTYIDPVTFVNRSIASCGRMDPHPVVVTITVMQNTWVLAVSDARGWVPDWTPLVLAVVVVVSLWVAATMAIILINRREHMWLLQAMLPKKVIATLRRGEEYAEAFESVTVLFSDIVSYTKLASEMEPIKVVRLLNEIYSAFDALVDQYECYKVETIGDAFMAVCGTQGEDAVAAAVKMARLAQAMVERTRVLVSADGQKIQIRIGLHSGPVVGAVVGFKMPHFCLCGDTVNTASRMESNSRPMSIHISDATAQLLLDSGEGFRLERRGPIDIKGKGVMVTHWLLPQASGDTAKTTAAVAAGAMAARAAVGAAATEAKPALPPPSWTVPIVPDNTQPGTGGDAGPVVSLASPDLHGTTSTRLASAPQLPLPPSLTIPLTCTLNRNNSASGPAPCTPGVPTSDPAATTPAQAPSSGVCGSAKNRSLSLAGVSLPLYFGNRGRNSEMGVVPGVSSGGRGAVMPAQNPQQQHGPSDGGGAAAGGVGAGISNCGSIGPSMVPTISASRRKSAVDLRLFQLAAPPGKAAKPSARDGINL